MLYTIHINQTVETVKGQIAQRLSAEGFGIVKEYSFKTLLKEKGFPIERDITVYELCNPAAAQEALSLHPELSVYLPCRISLYESDEGAVLSTIGIEDIMINFDLEPALKTKFYAMFERIKGVIESFE